MIPRRAAIASEVSVIDVLPIVNVRPSVNPRPDTRITAAIPQPPSVPAPRAAMTFLSR